MQWARSLFGAFVRSRRVVGTDLHGNKYYETIREGKKPKREMITNLKPMQYTPDMMPMEWEAWIGVPFLIRPPPPHPPMDERIPTSRVKAKRGFLPVE